MNASLRSSIRCAIWAGLAVAALLLVAAAPATAAAPRWEVESLGQPTNFAHGNNLNAYFITATNIGDGPTDEGDVTITDTLPEGMTAACVQFYVGDSTSNFGTCHTSNDQTQLCTTAPLQCTVTPAALAATLPAGHDPVFEPGEHLTMTVHVDVRASAAGKTLTNSVTVSGGGAPPASTSSSNLVSATPAPFGIQSLALLARNRDAAPTTQAGSHPYQVRTTVAINTDPGEPNFPIAPAADPKDIHVDLPPGLIGNPRAVPQCPLAAFNRKECSPDTQVGTATVLLSDTLERFNEANPAYIYNLVPPPGHPAELALALKVGPSYILVPSVRTGGDYGLRVTSAAVPIFGVQGIARMTIWGVPADSSHDAQRPAETSCGANCVGTPSDAPKLPFLTMPTRCSGSPLPAAASANSWTFPETEVNATTTLPAIDGCNQVSFEPTIEARPTTNHADSPSGLNVDLHLPLQGLEEPEATAESNLGDAVVTLPQGLTVNPSSASGLGACSEAQVDLSGQGPAQCPDAAKLGTVEVDTPLLDHPLPGAVYLAKPHENPFGSLLALYIAVDDPQTGVVVKLPGEITPDPVTGQLSATFRDNPQLPFEDFKLHFFPGALGALRTPATCGSYETTTSLTPWSAPESGPPATPHDEFQITGSASGAGACPASSGGQENAPRFHAGTENTHAGAFSPFSLKLVREDGSQELSKIDTTLPPGLTGKLAGVGVCSDAQLAQAASREHEGGGAEEQASPSCPPNTEVGSVDVGAGAGPTPLYVKGHAYLAGPYKGAPLSLAIVTPAVAGPFDLGTVVVRTALYVDPFTAQIHAVSDEIPHILQGIPLDVRSVTLKMNRPNFTLNPTNCDELGFTGSATSVQGAIAPLAQRFQVGGCAALPFKPKLAISLKGGVKRHTFPALTATLTMPPGQANVAAAQVTLPHNEQLEQAHITSQVCLQAQLATQTCPKASIYGYAKAETPLLDHPLEGPVYLGVGFGHKLPDLVAELNGQIRVLLHGKVDTGREDGLRNTFEVVPDAPVSKFTLHMFGGKKGLIVNSENLCGKHAKRKALARFTAQSGKVVEFEPTVANSCKHKHGKHSKGGHKHRPARRLSLLMSRGW